jgi:hypothetical protein
MKELATLKKWITFKQRKPGRWLKNFSLVLTPVQKETMYKEATSFFVVYDSYNRTIQQ